MILLFTYHKVSVGTEPGARDFYTVTREQLTKHFEALAATGRQCLSVSAVREQKPLPGNSFILSFDDGTADHIEIVLPQLRERGWTATFFVPTAKLNKPGYITDAQVRELAQAGHSIGFHSHEHRRLDLATDDQMREQISRSQQIVGDLIGGKPWLFAPPGGFMNEHVREVALGFGVEVIRTMRWGYNETLDLTALETIPINRYTNDAKFQKILQVRQTRYLYFGKQAMKALVPTHAYEKMRNLLFKLAGRN
jgi:peptidoglycan/xylan/chitin deacetylase (PgdA/CDA1 family)